MNPQHAESREYSMSEAPDDIEDPNQRAAWALGADRGYRDGVAAALSPHATTEQSEEVDEVMPPRPAGYNDASTDPGSPLQRWGKPRHEGAKLLLQPLDDGYWTPWHIANEMLRSAQSGDEAQLLADAEDSALLDWFVDHPNAVRRSYGYHGQSDGWWYDAPNGEIEHATDLRDALRAAREATGGAKS